MIEIVELHELEVICGFAVELWYCPVGRVRKERLLCGYLATGKHVLWFLTDMHLSLPFFHGGGRAKVCRKIHFWHNLISVGWIIKYFR